MAAARRERTNQRIEREEYSALTKAELRHRIHSSLKHSGLDLSSSAEKTALGGSQAKRELMQHWESGDPMTRLDLQRILRIVQELEAKKGSN